MSRYIDAEALVKYANNQKDKTVDANVIMRFSTADVVEVVRCKDCIYNDRGWCGAQEYGTHHIEDNDFCSQGERKEQEHEPYKPESEDKE